MCFGQQNNKTTAAAVQNVLKNTNSPECMLPGSLVDLQNDCVECFLVTGIFIVAAKRTPFGTYGGKFVKKSITDLQEVANKAAIVAAGLKPEQIDSVVIGNVFPVSRAF